MCPATAAQARAWRRRLDREAHLWLARPDEVSEQRLREIYESLLTPDERARADRCLRHQSRVESVVGHGLRRMCLSKYRPVSPSAWRFRRGAQGRPEIVIPEDADLRFNVSHSAGLVACVVTVGVACGVDVERIHRAEERVRRAARLLSEVEAQALEALPVAERGARFFVHWTLKEAYLKARGTGLSIELDQVRFAVGTAGAATATFGPETADDERRWQLYWTLPTPTHALSLVLELSGAPRTIVAMDCGLNRV
jgi:4'-phosphopantetheinyl transferase